MQTFDVVLKLLFEQSRQMLSQLTGSPIESWLPIELPRLQNQRVDLLGRVSSGNLLQLEFQSTNDPTMPLRMAEYSLGVYRLHNEFPRQIVLYVGRESMQMSDRLEWHAGSFTYRLIDLREIDSQPLLASPDTSDNVLSILTRFSNQRRAVEQVLAKVALEKDLDRRGFYLQALLVLAGLRGLEEEVEKEARKMPVFYDILDNKVLGREYKRGHQEGRRESQEEARQEGLQEGRRQGHQEGERLLLRRMIEKRFGVLPDWASERLAQLSEQDLPDVGLRLSGAQSLEQLLS